MVVTFIGQVYSQYRFYWFCVISAAHLKLHQVIHMDSPCAFAVVREFQNGLMVHLQ